MIAFSEVSIGTGAFVSCVRCAAEKGALASSPRPAAEVLAELEQIARGWTHGPGPNCAFVGFEPFAHPELPRLIAAAAAAGFARIRLRTDGGALAQPGNADGALTAGVRQLELIVLAEGEAHDKLTGRPGLSAASMRGVAAFTSAAERAGATVALSALIPVCAHAVAQLPHAVGAAAGLGATSVTLEVSALPQTPENTALVRAALDTATINRIAASVIGWESGFAAPYDRTPSLTIGVPS